MSDISKTMRSAVGVFIIMCLSAGLMFLTQVVLAWELTKDEMGTFKLVVVISTVLGGIAALGQNNNFVRFFSRTSVDRYNWRRSSFYIVLIGSAVALILCISLSMFYSLSTIATVTTCIVAFSIVGVSIYSSILRSSARYIAAKGAQESARILFPLIILLLFALSGLQLKTAFILLAICFLLSFAGAYFLTVSLVKNSIERMPKRVYLEGIYFLMLIAVVACFNSFDYLTIGKMLTRSELGVYGVTRTMMRGYDLVAISLGYVLVPHFAKVVRIDMLRSHLYVVAAASGLTLAYLLFGTRVLHFLFEGEYDEGAFLIKWFSLGGIGKILYTLPMAIITGRLNSRALKVFAYASVGIAVLSLPMCYLLVKTSGLKGAAVAVAISRFTIIFTAYWIMIKHWKKGVSQKPKEFFDMAQ